MFGLFNTRPAQRLVAALSLALVLSSSFMPVAAQAQVPGASLPSLAPMVSRVSPGVVGISVAQAREQDNPLHNSPVFRDPYTQRGDKGGGREAKPAGAPEVRPAGSGVVINAKEGLVLTNHHVIQGASRVVVVLKDRREMEAKVIGSDAGVDVALLKIAPENLSEVPLGNSDALAVGDFVVAIGNPFGIGQTVTSGIVSALSRGISPEGYEDYVQTDAAINPGNSGGALLNLNGELIGINTAILGAGPRQQGQQSGNIGIGFAVPINMARAVIVQLQKYGEVRRGRIGLQGVDLTPRLARERSLRITEGALIEQVERDSPAAKANVKPGDVVTEVNGRAVRGVADLRNQVALIAVGDPVNLRIHRGGQDVRATLAVAPIQAPTLASNGGKGSEGSGTVPGNPPGERPPVGGSEALASGVTLRATGDGLQVVSVAANSRLYAAGVRPGDMLIGLDREPLRSVDQFSNGLRNGGDHVISILRGESKLRVVVR